MNDSAIVLKDVTFNYGRLKVINGISLEIPKGISFGLLGSNGAGKTTLIRLMVGLLKPAAGEITCLGFKPAPANARNIGYMPQLASLYAELSVRQNLDFFASIYGLRDRLARRARVEETIKIIDLWNKRDVPVSQLSGGMRQRVSLGCAIVHRPPLLFLDEPTVGLDPELRYYFWDYFNRLISGGSTLIISSHTMDDAAHCSQLAFMRDGRIIALGTPMELKAATGRPDANLEEAFLYYFKRGEVKSGV
jgi:ABC-2 type transport system ATP-binding protein